MVTRRGARAILMGTLMVLSAVGRSSAQTQAPRVSGWEIEGYGGFSLIRLPSGGVTELPAAGPPLTSTNPTFPARRTSSWLFGDGASMFNDAAAELGLSARLTPLDAAFVSLGHGATAGGAFGARVRRRALRRMDFEAGIDVLTGSAKLPDTLRDATEATRASFESAMTALFASGPFVNTSVSATIDTAGGSSRELALTGGVSFRLRDGDGLIPFVTVGGGVITGASDGESISIEGRYRTTTAVFGIDFPPALTIEETDRVTLRYGHATTYVAVAGGGMRRDFSDRWAMRLEGRVFLGANNTRLLLDADPGVARSAPAGFIETFTYPNLQFSTDPTSGRESTLSGDALRGFEAFSGDGLQMRFLVTIGIVRRF